MKGTYMLYEATVRPILFAMSQNDAEIAHTFAVQVAKLAQAEPHILRLIAWWFKASQNPRPATVAGITFPNRVGLAAGFDKHGEILPFLQALGFGFVGIGTVLPRYQKGNDRPRLFRIPEEQALINRMGFNSRGAEAVAQNLSAHCSRIRIPIGISLGKMRETPNEDAVQDYIDTWARLRTYSAYGVGNISSPNTPGLRELQSVRYIERFARELVGAERDFANQAGEKQKPLFFKLSPDLSYHELTETIGACESAGVSGFIVGNTTTTRPHANPNSPTPKEVGGMSGRPLYYITWHMFRLARQLTKLPIMFVGGLDSEERVEEAFDRGADLIQFLSALIYKGPVVYLCRTKCRVRKKHPQPYGRGFLFLDLRSFSEVGLKIDIERLRHYLLLFFGLYAVYDQNLLKLLALERLHRNKPLGYRVEGFAMHVDDVLRFFVGLVDNATHLGVYLAGNFFGIRAAFNACAKHRVAALALERDGAHLFAHTPTCDHVAREVGEHLQVIGGAGGHIAKDGLLRNIAAEAHRDVVQKLFFALHAPIFKRELECVARSTAAADDGNFVHRVGVRQERGNERVPRLVVGGYLLFFFV